MVFANATANMPSPTAWWTFSIVRRRATAPRSTWIPAGGFSSRSKSSCCAVGGAGGAAAVAALFVVASVELPSTA